MVRLGQDFASSASNLLVSDEELVACFQAGDDSAFDQLFFRYNQKLCNYLGHLVGDDDAGRDLAQDTFVKAYYRLPQGTECFKAWLYRVGHNAAIDHLRYWKSIIPWKNYTDNITLISVEGPERRTEEAELIKMAIKSIHKKYRAPIYLYFVEEMKQSEIAICLGIGERSVRRYIVEGVGKLTQAYEHFMNDSTTSERGDSHRG